MDDDFLKPRTCLAEPAPEIYTAARLLDAAVDAHLAGESGTAAALIAEADMEALGTWRHSIMGPVNRHIIRYRNIDSAPPTLAKNQRIGTRMPSAATRRALIDRDGFNCRFCGMPVITKSVRNAIRDHYPEVLRWGRRDAERHEAFLCMWLQYDHVLPHSRGGTSNPDNIVITCAPCNYGRGEYTIEEVGLVDPRTRPARRSAWDGLARFRQASPSL